MDHREMLRSTAAAAAAGFLLSPSAPQTAAGDEPPHPVRLRVRGARERGHANHGWLDTWHTFSFATYQDPDWMGFRSLRVVNEDRVAPGKGFSLHPHRDMEILTCVLEGSLEHKDTLGNGSIIVPGEVQRMSAGTGIWHSEFNPSAEDPVHLLQIWILPDRRGVEPSYDQRKFEVGEWTNTLRLVASKSGHGGSIAIHQDANVHLGRLEAGRQLVWHNPPGRHVWLQVARGALSANGRALGPGDGAFTSDVGDLGLAAAASGAEVVLFDLA